MGSLSNSAIGQRATQVNEDQWELMILITLRGNKWEKNIILKGVVYVHTLQINNKDMSPIMAQKNGLE